MDRERYENIQEVFLRACELPAAERARHLKEACGADAELRSEVEKLLRYDEEPLGFIDDRAVATGEGLAQRALGAAGDREEDPARPPERIGHYRVIRLIGRGGMGVVYEAEQDEPRRRVALKVIQSALASEGIRSRFRLESELLGQLHHPGIARIYEAGSDDDLGVPFIALELIEGRPLPEYVEAKKPGTRERLELIAKVCDAVHHAHLRGVIHRDLKPGNILVEEGAGEPQPKVLDFGIARATNADLNTVTVATQTGQIIGTIPYMSPEQASGDPARVDSRSDVYSLGVVLFEVLAGRHPHDLRRCSVADAVRVIQEEEPSRLTSFDMRLRGDVEVIVAKALEKDVERRYPSAAALAADIRHHLADEPIQARPPSALYQLRKFARRNKALVAGVCVAFLALAGGLVASLWFAHQAGRSAEVANDERERAEAINDFLLDMLRNARIAGEGSEVTLVEAIERSIERLDERFDDQPLVKAEILSTIGLVYSSLRNSEETVEIFDRAIAIYTRVLGPDALETLRTEARRAEARAIATRDFREAEPVLRELLERAERHLGPKHEVTLLTRSRLGETLQVLGRYAEAESELRRTLEDSVGTATEVRGYVLNSLGACFGAQEKLDEAIEAYEAALPEVRRRGDVEGLIAITVNLCNVLMDKGRLAEAEGRFSEVLPIVEERVPDGHQIRGYSYSTYGRILRRLERHEEAAEYLRRSFSNLAAAMGEDKYQTALAARRVYPAYERLGRFADAEVYCRKAVEILTLRVSRGRPGSHEAKLLVESTRDLADILVRQEKHDEAITTLDTLGELAAKHLDADDPVLFEHRGDRGAVLVSQGRHADAEKVLLSAWSGLEKAGRAETSEGRRVASSLVRLYAAWNRPEDAVKWKGRAGDAP